MYGLENAFKIGIFGVSEGPNLKIFPGLRPWTPLGGLQRPPTPQLLGLASLVFLATLVNISYFFNYEDLHPCAFKLLDFSKIRKRGSVQEKGKPN